LNPSFTQDNAPSVCGPVSRKVCNLRCPPSFPHRRADGEPYCYNTATYAAHNGGPCQSWCSLNPRFTRDNAPSVCGPVSSKLCWGSADIMTLPSLPLPEDLPDAEESVGLSSLPMLNSVPASEVTELVGVCSDPAFPYHRADGEPYCYSSSFYANSNGGPCRSWCSLNPSFTQDNAPSVCGPVSRKVCNLRCPPSFPHRRADGEPYCYNTATYAAHNGGPCQSWCSLNPRFTRDNAPSVCGPVSRKLCWGSADIINLPSSPENVSGAQVARDHE